MDLLERVRRTAVRHQLFAPGDGVVVGVSGGPDSVCLLHVLRRLSADYALRLHVAHLHHGLRRGEADADAEYVQGLAREWELLCTTEWADVPSLARAGRLSFEEAARQVRYAFLARLADQVGAAAVAVGHSADDQAETVLMHWLRGAGLAGLRGMRPDTPLNELCLDAGGVAPLPTGAGVRLIRPLLEVSRGDVEAYCAEHGLVPRSDASNLDTTHYRNWLRHKVLPLLAQHNPRVAEVLRRSAEVAAADYDLLRDCLREAWVRVVIEESSNRIAFDLEGWRALPVALQRMALREAIHRLRRSLRNISLAHVDDAVALARSGTPGQAATLPQGLALSLGYHQLFVANAGEAAPQPDWPLLGQDSGPLEVTLPGHTALPGSSWRFDVVGAGRGDLPPGWERNADRWLAYLDADSVQPPVWLRPRRSGDRFCPLGMGGQRVKLADYYTNRKVPRGARSRLPLVSDALGIVWVVGLHIDERVRVREESQAVWVCRFGREGE